MKTTKSKNKARGQRGFTIIETAIASLVMLVGALAVSTLFLYSTQNNIGGSERALAMAVAQQQLEQIRSVTFEDTTLGVGTTTATVTNGGRPYTVQRVIANENHPDGTPKQLKKITIRVTPQSAPNWISTTVELVTLRSTLASGSYLVSD